MTEAKGKLRQFVVYCLSIGGIAHFIEFGFAIYETAYITAGITLLFGFLDFIAAYIIKSQ
tara:strand:- start:872 stop:1051 length:180 start_codon:yes stop_codon:yes gene_type:complete